MFVLLFAFLHLCSSKTDQLLIASTHSISTSVEGSRPYDPTTDLALVGPVNTVELKTLIRGLSQHNRDTVLTLARKSPYVPKGITDADRQLRRYYGKSDAEIQDARRLHADIDWIKDATARRVLVAYERWSGRRTGKFFSAFGFLMESQRLIFPFS